MYKKKKNISTYSLELGNIKREFPMKLEPMNIGQI